MQNPIFFRLYLVSNLIIYTLIISAKNAGIITKITLLIKNNITDQNFLKKTCSASWATIKQLNTTKYNTKS